MREVYPKAARVVLKLTKNGSAPLWRLRGTVHKCLRACESAAACGDTLASLLSGGQAGTRALRAGCEFSDIAWGPIKESWLLFSSFADSRMRAYKVTMLAPRRSSVQLQFFRRTVTAAGRNDRGREG